MMPISRTTSALDAALERYAAQRTIAGGSLLVQLHGEDVYYHDCGYMDAEAKRAPARGDVYRIFSMTKPITMTALLQLCERGALRLTDRVEDYFPEFAATPVLYRNAEGELVCEEQHTPITLLLHALCSLHKSFLILNRAFRHAAEELNHIRHNTRRLQVVERRDLQNAAPVARLADMDI